MVSGRKVALGESVIADVARVPGETVDEVFGRGRGRGRGRGGARDTVKATGEGLRGCSEIWTLGIVDGALIGALSKDFSKEVGKFSKRKIY